MKFIITVSDDDGGFSCHTTADQAELDRRLREGEGLTWGEFSAVTLWSALAQIASQRAAQMGGTVFAGDVPDGVINKAH